MFTSITIRRTRGTRDKTDKKGLKQDRYFEQHSSVSIAAMNEWNNKNKKTSLIKNIKITKAYKG